MTSPSLFRAVPVQSYYNTEQLAQSSLSLPPAACQSSYTLHLLAARFARHTAQNSKRVDSLQQTEPWTWEAEV